MKNIKGNAWIAILIMMTFLITASLSVTGALVRNLKYQNRKEKEVIAQAIADGALELSVWRLNKTVGTYNGESNLAFPDGVVDIQVIDEGVEDRTVVATAYVPNKANPIAVKKTLIKASIDYNIVNFNYGIQVGSRGVTMDNLAYVNGNVYSNGPIRGGFLTWVHGDAYSAEAGGLFEDMYADNVHAHTLRDSWIGDDAYYQVKSSTYVGGTNHPGSPDPVALDLPITDEDITEWKGWAADPTGETVTGDMNLNNTTRTFGPGIITGNLNISNGGTLILQGPVHVYGTINVSGTIFKKSTIRMDSAMGGKSTMIISDGTAHVFANTEIKGTGTAGSYIMMLSTSTSVTAIEVEWASSGVVYAAPHGTVDLKALVWVRSVIAEGIRMRYAVGIDYLSGLSSLDFTTGPGASWQIKEWKFCGLNDSCG